MVFKYLILYSWEPETLDLILLGSMKTKFMPFVGPRQNWSGSFIHLYVLNVLSGSPEVVVIILYLSIKSNNESNKNLTYQKEYTPLQALANVVV